jgi:hypothetical protein
MQFSLMMTRYIIMKLVKLTQLGVKFTMESSLGSSSLSGHLTLAVDLKISPFLVLIVYLQ